MRNKNFISIVFSVFLCVVFVAVAVNAATTISTNISTAGTLSVTGLSTLLGGATTTSITLLNGEVISNATDGVIQLGGIASTTSLILLNGETITNAADGVIQLLGTSSTTGITLLNGETITNTTDGTITLTAATTSLSGLGLLANGFLSQASSTVVGNLTVTGTFSPAQTTATAFAVGGGYGDTGVTISEAGVIQANGALTADGLATFLGGATTTTLTLLNGEIISNATDGVIQLGGIASTTSLTLLNGETITNATDGVVVFSGKAKIGTDTSTNAISLVNTAGSDFGLETYTKLATDMAGGWYAGSNSYMTVPIAQSGDTSVFGSISELDLGTAITFAGSNAGAMWADLEILGATDIGASNAVTPVYTGAVIATIVSNSTGMVVPANRHLAGVVVDSSMTSGYTDNGEVSGIVIRRSTSSKAPWPVGLRIKSGAATLGIDSNAKVRIGTAAGATGIAIDGTDPDYGLQTHTLISSDLASNAYSSNYTTMTVTGAQTHDTSVFGNWSELYLGTTDVTLTLGGSNYGAMWGNLEISGTTNIGASNAVTPVYSGAVVATVIGSATMVVPAYRDFAGVIADSNLTTGYTNSGTTTAAFMIRKSSGKAVWPVGLMIKGGSVTTDIQLQSGDTIKNPVASTTVISGALTVGPVNYAADAGSSDAYVITLAPAPSAYVAGMMIVFTVNTANTDGATINVNGLGAKNLVKGNNAALATNDMIVNRTYIAVYDGTQFDLINPTTQ